MSISFTGETSRSVGDLFLQAIVDSRVIGCFATSRVLSLCDCAHQKIMAGEVYCNYHDWIELAASNLIHTGSLASVIIRGHDLAVPRASSSHGGVPAYNLDRTHQSYLIPRSLR